jgi:hypothetical protein
MASGLLIRRLNLTGWTFDAAWTDPANVPPMGARRLKFTMPTVQFALVGKDGTGGAALDVDVGTLTVNAWLGMKVGTQVRRGATIVEATGSELSSRIHIISNDAIPGTFGWLNIANLLAVGSR